MIAFVRGPVAAIGVDSAVIEVGGVGMQVFCHPGTLAGLRPGQEARVATSMVVREDSLTLYGFADDDEKSLFELLLTASGVGPKLAQAALAVLSPDQLRQAVASEDLAMLVKVPGIGKKGAQRVVLELKDKIGAPSKMVAGRPLQATEAWKDQVQAGLVGLGWSARDAEDAVVAVSPLAAEGEPSVPDLLRAALRVLSKA
ncbi:Holliday junction DNA helicase RuvA [Kribbella flavida DSM 17836]|uniref:Holliday junction branch migration complex subunit RuvA n=1 Tax=Kribbella flavida (strain DSM 17836 / JCM 10339 / NBRC 14399) TaxID=479435 RepID=D2PVF6_KRIFD|nr:Holliday junction branch migration protein RuvA [Kribbella flavida]ADB33437.1 Holliday junction DNA helicase RuvA [Kribbella flavida DSM 17836]